VPGRRILHAHFDELGRLPLQSLVLDGRQHDHRLGQAGAGIMAAIAIANASHAQHDGIEQMRGTIQDIEQTTRQTVLLAEQSASAVGTMCEHAASVEQAVGTLRRTDLA
jgi:hypothetical protein